ncbi:MAG: hypothetical protein JWM16_1304 [Verrucomicrobiales bacterium]|nr:hypothetical protein [Verrucomicrobiales bacterium]
MHFTAQIGSKPSRLDFYRSPWLGGVRILLDGQPVAERSPLLFSTHFNFQMLKKYQFRAEAQEVVVEHHRPLLFAGLRPQTYRVLVDGRVVREVHGY